MKILNGFGVTQAHGQQLDMDWPELKGAIKKHSVPNAVETDEAKRDGPWFSLAEYQGGHRRRDKIIGKVGGVVLDLDQVHDPDRLFAALKPYEYIGWTTWNSTDDVLRARVVVPVEGGVTVENFAPVAGKIIKRVERYAKVDPKSLSPEQLWFFPVHKKSQTQHHRIWENRGRWLSSTPSRLLHVDFKDVVNVQRPEAISHGDRNNSVAKYLRGPDGLRCESQADLRDLALKWNDRLKEPMGRKEVLDTARKAWNWMQTPGGIRERARVARHEVSQLMRGEWLPAGTGAEGFERWVVHEVVPESGIVVIYGPPGSMKTLVVIDLAGRIVLSLDWHGHEIDRPEVVAIVSTEGPASWHRRVRAWARDHRVDVAILGKSMFIWDGALDLNDPDSVAAFIGSIPALTARCNGHVPRVWIIDTFARAMSGDENTKDVQNAAQTAYHGIAGAIGCKPLLVLVHHSGKDPTREERGHSSLRAAVDTSIRISVGESSGERATQERKEVLVKSGTAEIAKQRDGGDGIVFGFDVYSIFVGTDDKGRARSQAVVRHVEDVDAAIAAVRKKKNGGSAKTIASAINDAYDALGGGEVKWEELLKAVAKARGQDATELRGHFSRDIQRAGLVSMRQRPGVPAMVKRP
jgi:hypothetical protein